MPITRRIMADVCFLSHESHCLCSAGLIDSLLSSGVDSQTGSRMREVFGEMQKFKDPLASLQKI